MITETMNFFTAYLPFLKNFFVVLHYIVRNIELTSGLSVILMLDHYKETSFIYHKKIKP
jgi:hypothetical protein